MRVKNGFIVRKIADSYMAVPVKERTQTVSGIIALSETGAFLWNELKTDTTEDKLVNRLCEEYEVAEEQARLDVQAFIENLRVQGWLDEDIE